MISMDHLAESRERTEMVRNLERKQEYGIFFQIFTKFFQCFGSGLNPDSIRSVDPDPDPGGQKRKRNKKFNVLKCWMFSFEG
jgi:hypothetical protein